MRLMPLKCDGHRQPLHALWARVEEVGGAAVDKGGEIAVADLAELFQRLVLADGGEGFGVA